MADINMKDFVDALTADTSPESTDLVYVRTSAGNRKMTVQNLLNGVSQMPVQGRDGGDIGGYLMDGVDDYITVPDNANLDFGLSDFSLELFVRLADYTPSAELILLEKHASNLGYKLLLTTAGKLKLQFGNGTNFTTFSYESDAIGTIDDSWAHFLVTADRDGNALFYVNGILNKTVDISGSVAQTLDNTGALNIFGNGTSYTLGRVAIVSVYNRVMTATEIANAYNNGRPDLNEMTYSIRNASMTNRVVNGTMELDSDWNPYNSPSTNERSSEQARTGTYSRKVITNGASQGISSTVSGFVIPVLPGKTFKVSVGVYPTAETAYVLQMRNGGSTAGQSSASKTCTLNQWNEITLTFTAGSTVPTNIAIIATNAGSTFYVDDAVLIPLGNCLEYRHCNAGSLGWIESSGNQLSGSTSGSPICLTKEARPPHYRDIRKTIAANTNTTLTNIVPRGYKIVSIRAKGSDSLADIKIGTASAGEQIVAATTTSSTIPKLLTLAATANDAYSESADVTLYARHDTSASGKTMDLIFHFEKVGN